MAEETGLENLGKLNRKSQKGQGKVSKPQMFLESKLLLLPPLLLWGKLKGKSLIGYFLFLFTSTPAAYGSSQARGRIRAAAAGLHHSHGNSGSELHL